VKHPRIAVRAKPDVKARLAGTRKQGEELTVLRTSGGWAKLSESEYCLIDGSALGFGTLIERKDEPVRLKIINPQDGSALCDIDVRTTTTVLEARQKVGAFTTANGGRLRWQSMAASVGERGRGRRSPARATHEHRSIVPARGKMGTRIIDSKYNTFEDSMTLAACDLDDGDEIGFCYLGNAQEDLKMED